MFAAIWDFIFYSIPWYIWTGLGLLAAVIVWRLLGTKGALAVLAAVAIFSVDRRARQAGRKHEIEREEARRKAALERRIKINKEVAKRKPEENRKRLDKWTIEEGEEK